MGATAINCCGGTLERSLGAILGEERLLEKLRFNVVHLFTDKGKTSVSLARDCLLVVGLVFEAQETLEYLAADLHLWSIAPIGIVSVRLVLRVSSVLRHSGHEKFVDDQVYVGLNENFEILNFDLHELFSVRFHLHTDSEVML